MKQYKYNAEFFGKWMDEHPEITQRAILKVLDTKDYQSLKRWAAGYEMPTKSIVKLCNAFDIAIENFFIGMLSIVKEEPKQNNGDNVIHNEASGDDSYAITTIGGTCEATVQEKITPAKQLQLEARHQKDILLREKQYQQKVDEIRAEYDRRMDEQRKDFMAQIDTLIKQNASLTTLAINGSTYATPFMAERPQKNQPNIHPDPPQPSRKGRGY